MLGSLKEYLPAVRPQKVFWFFCENNDFHELKKERTPEKPLFRRSRHKMKIVFCLLALACFLPSCSHHYHSERFGYVVPPPNEKNIIMPSESSDFIEKIKEALRAKGWNTLEPIGPSASQGKTRKGKIVKDPEERVAPYTLEISSKFISKCVYWDNFIEYHITLINNTTGKTIFSMDDQRCDDKVIHQFMSMIETTDTSLD